MDAGKRIKVSSPWGDLSAMQHMVQSETMFASTLFAHFKAILCLALRCFEKLRVGNFGEDVGGLPKPSW